MEFNFLCVPICKRACFSHIQFCQKTCFLYAGMETLRVIVFFFMMARSQGNARNMGHEKIGEGRGSSLYYAKSFAYVNNMPWGLVNYEYKGPRCARPLHSTLGRRLE